MGHPAGTPALLIHGAVNGYLYPPEFEHALVALRIKLFALHRPGWGNSDRIKKLDLCDDIERAVRAFVAHLGLNSLPVIALCAGVIPAMRLSCMVDSPVSAILACGPFFPFTKARFSRMAGKSKTPWFGLLAMPPGSTQFSPKSATGRCLNTVLTGIWSKVSNCSRLTNKRPLILKFFRSCETLLHLHSVQGAEALFEEWTMRNRDASLAAPAMSVPMHSLLGAVHIYKGLTSREELDTVAEIDYFLALNPLISFERIPDAGELMVYQKPELIVQRLAALMA